METLYSRTLNRISLQQILVSLCVAFCIMLCGCREDDLMDGIGTSGEYHYCLHATIEKASTRVSVLPDDSNSGLDMHWEEGDEIVLTPDDDSSARYVFKAVPYIYNTTAQNPVQPKGDSELGEDDILVYFFEYQGTQDIPNADNFYGTATYKPSDYKDKNNTEEGKEPECLSRLVLTQSKEGDSSHLRRVETLTAKLEGVNLAKNAYSWVKNNEWENNFFDHHDHVVFQHGEGCYAFLKIILHGFKYSIWGEGSVNVYIMDETPDMVNDEYVPNAKLLFGNKNWKNSDNYISLATTNVPDGFIWPNMKDEGFSSDLFSDATAVKYPKADQTPFIYVPEYWVQDGDYFKQTSNPEWFDTKTQQYIKEDVSAVFYVPIDPVKITGGYYIDVVLQDGWSGDLYVWQKKVPYTMTLEAGQMYTLDYRDKRTEYAMKIVDNLTYVRSTYLEQEAEGPEYKGCLYDIKGNKVKVGDVSEHPNRFAYPSDPGYMNKEEILQMRQKHAAFYATSTPMAGICRYAFQRFNINSDGSWTNNKLTVTSQAIVGENPVNNVLYSKDYMKKITKGYINPDSDLDCGNVMSKPSSSSDESSTDRKQLCIEYVLDNRFDPVMRSPKTSNLWRTPYGRDINALCNKTYTIVFNNADEKYITIESIKTGHRICVAYMPEIAEKTLKNQTLRGTEYDGSDGNTSTWDLTATPYAEWRFSTCRSIRSFGTNNPAYFQMIAPAVLMQTNSDGTKTCKGSAGLVNNFSVAYPVLPVFKWRQSKTDNDDRLILWGNVTLPE